MSLKETRGALNRQWRQLEIRWKYPNFADDPGIVRFMLGAVIVIIVATMLAAWFGVPFHVTRVSKGELTIEQPTRYSVAFNSFNPETGQAEATVNAAPHYGSSRAFENEKIDNQLCLVSPMKITDLGLDVFLFGVRPSLLSPAEELSVASTTSTSQYSWKKEETQRATFKIVGNLTRYPFDRYLIAGSIDQMIGYEPPSHGIPFRKHLVADSIAIDFNIPGYNAKRISEKELISWVSFVGQGLEPYTEEQKRLDQSIFVDHKKYWNDHVFYFEIERPALFRNLAALIGVVALISIVTVTLMTEPREMVKTLAGSLIALWGLRNILGANGPKIPTVLDYGVLLLFVLQLSIVAYRLLVRPVNTEAQDPVSDA